LFGVEPWDGAGPNANDVGLMGDAGIGLSWLGVCGVCGVVGVMGSFVRRIDNVFPVSVDESDKLEADSTGEGGTMWIHN
jgi:hypothetical protein